MKGILPATASRSDQEFLPAALELLERPASPKAVALGALICTLFASALVWAVFGRIDIVASAQGKVQPAGRVKLVQPLETGRVQAIRATNGQHVEAGEVLVELDPAEVEAEENSLAANLSAFRAEEVRRRAAVDAAERGSRSPPAIDWPEDVPAAARLREERVLKADLDQLNATLASVEAQRAQKRAERGRSLATEEAQTLLLATLKERLDMRSSLLGTGSGTRASVIDARESYDAQVVNRTYSRGQVAEAEAAIAVLDAEADKAVRTFLADNNQKRAEAERQAADYRERLSKAHARTGHMTLASPAAGVVQGSTVHTVGQVVTTGEEVMRLVPDGSALEIEAYVANKDIGFVHEGDPAVIKIESFPFTRYGTLSGHVVRVATDAIPEPDASGIEAGQTRSPRAPTIGGAQRVQNLVFPVVIAPDQLVVKADGHLMPVSSGMAVAVEINTGRRRLISYLLSPIAEVTSTALRER